ncbi:MAG: hypothetical protein IJ328_05645 [Muribaculaceae bacterium]|nr:hypothetical protein [Muribaculaceae bacterium]
MRNNNTFSFMRFALLFRKDIVENRKFYLLGTLVMFGISVIVISMFGFGKIGSIVPETIDLNYDYICFSILGFSLIFSSVVFGRMQSKAKRISEIVLPASALEKFMVKWLIAVVLFVAVFVFVLFCAIYVSSLIIMAVHPDAPLIGVNHLGKNELITFVVAYLLMQAFYIWGGVAMPKLSFVKTSVLLFVCMLVFGIYYNVIGSFAGVLFDLYPADTYWDARIFLGVITVMLWCLAYYRYKEETVNYKLL